MNARRAETPRRLGSRPLLAENSYSQQLTGVTYSSQPKAGQASWRNSDSSSPAAYPPLRVAWHTRGSKRSRAPTFIDLIQHSHDPRRLCRLRSRKQIVGVLTWLPEIHEHHLRLAVVEAWPKRCDQAHPLPPSSAGDHPCGMASSKPPHHQRIPTTAPYRCADWLCP